MSCYVNVLYEVMKPSIEMVRHGLPTSRQHTNNNMDRTLHSVISQVAHHIFNASVVPQP